MAYREIRFSCIGFKKWQLQEDRSIIQEMYRYIQEVHCHYIQEVSSIMQEVHSYVQEVSSIMQEVRRSIQEVCNYIGKWAVLFEK